MTLLLALTVWASTESLEYEIHDDLICFPLESAGQVATALEYYHVFWGTNQLYSNEMLAMSNRVSAYSNKVNQLQSEDDGIRVRAVWCGIGAVGAIILRLVIRAIVL